MTTGSRELEANLIHPIIKKHKLPLYSNYEAIQLVNSKHKVAKIKIQPNTVFELLIFHFPVFVAITIFFSSFSDCFSHLDI